MPSVTTSSATGSRVLQKPMATDTQDLPRDEATAGKATASGPQQDTSPGKRSSSSSTMSSKIKRFPTLLSRKEGRSKAESASVNGHGSGPRSASGADGRRKSTSSSASGLPKPTTPAHGRSISLASATPSSLPRPVAVAGLPSSATSPNLAGISNGNVSEQPSSPTAFGGSPRRVPPPGQESGIPRLITSPRSASDAQKEGQRPGYQEGGDSAVHDATPAQTSGPINGSLGQDESRIEGPASEPSTTKLYVVNADNSPDPNTSEAATSSEHMSRTSSGSRIPVAMAKTTAKNTTPQTSTSPDTSVPAMWRSNSYEGTAQAYMMAAQGGSEAGAPASTDIRDTKSVVSNTGDRQNRAYSGQTAIGIEGLRELENDASVTSNPAISHRLQLLRQLVFLRGEAVLSGVDVTQIVWARGTDADLSVEEEFSRARNGKALSQAGSPVSTSAPQIVQPVASTVSTSKKHGIIDRVTARFGGGPKPHHDEQTQTNSRQDATDVGGTPPILASGETAGSLGVSEPAAVKKGPVFGTPLQEIPPLAMAISIIGGQRHQLPILVFSLVEAIFKRGLETSGIFRMNGNAASVQRLVEIYNTWPSYGDDHNTDDETIFTLCEVLKRYLKDLPEPLLGGPLWSVFVYGCLADRGAQDEAEHYKRMGAVQVIFRLLPRKNMSLLIYLIAFLYQVSLRPANRLTTESISVIFGPSLLGTSKADTNVTNGVNSSKASAEGLRWLLDNWEDSLSQDLLDEDYDCFASPYVGQTAWSTPNLLGEMQPNPFSRSKDGAGLAQDAQAASARSPDGTSNLEDTDLSPGARIEMPDSEPVQTADHGIGLDQDNRSPDTHNAGQGVAHTQNPKSGLRSVSGFAKGENISDDDIASDPNAAQLFGSLSQLFNSERRKAKAYQQQVQELQTQQAEYTSTIKDLQNTLAQRNMDMNGLQSEIGALNSRIAKLESEVSEALSTSQSYHDSVREAQRALEEKERLHTSTLEAKQNEIGVLGQKHQEELERQRVEHSRTLNRELSALQEQHSGEKEQEAIARKKVHEEELAHIRSEHETERGQLIEEIRQLREAIQVSDKDRDAARAHLQRIRTLLDSA